jgi:hypothetical protein
MGVLYKNPWSKEFKDHRDLHPCFSKEPSANSITLDTYKPTFCSKSLVYMRVLHKQKNALQILSKTPVKEFFATFSD